MTVYTVMSVDDNPTMEPLDQRVLGTYTTQKCAIEKCIDYIMSKLKLRYVLAWSMAHDGNHPEAKRFFAEKRKNGRTVVRKGCVTRLREFLRHELEVGNCYYVYDGTNSWYFDVVESDVKGELWTTVTWGDSDCEDLEFTTPWPAIFTSEETAIKAFIDYVKDLFRNNDIKWSDKGVRETRNALREDGRVQVNLRDGYCVSCVLYRDNTKNIKE